MVPRIPKIKLPTHPLEPLREIVRGGRERLEEASSDIHSIAEDLRGNILNITTTIQETEKATEIEPQSRTASPTTGVSKLTNDEILAYQNREMGRELWQLEKHLAQGCRIPDKSGKRIPCDCCAKGGFIAGLAYESIPIAERGGKPSTTYEKIAKWAEELEPMVTVLAVESGQYDYTKLSGQASALRKELMGSLALGALLSPKDRTEIAERATKMLEGEEI